MDVLAEEVPTTTEVLAELLHEHDYYELIVLGVVRGRWLRPLCYRWSCRSWREDEYIACGNVERRVSSLQLVGCLLVDHYYEGLREAILGLKEWMRIPERARAVDVFEEEEPSDSFYVGEVVFGSACYPVVLQLSGKPSLSEWKRILREKWSFDPAPSWHNEVVEVKVGEVPLVYAHFPIPVDPSLANWLVKRFGWGIIGYKRCKWGIVEPDWKTAVVTFVDVEKAEKDPHSALFYSRWPIWISRALKE